MHYPQYQTYCNPGLPKELGGPWANTKSGRHCCNLQFAYHYQCAVVYDNDATLATWERGYANRISTYLVERPLLSQACVWQLQKRAVQSWTSKQSHLLVRFKVQGGLNSTPTRASAVCQFELRAGVQKRVRQCPVRLRAANPSNTSRPTSTILQAATILQLCEQI